ncbi:uncharacterized protein BDW70DRAFT_155619 [Aspergillus foveolatus]|uniref:uncharacterized protein n=1 Tax=Aspergillus foveolatus TaxID=210207 RepID=UPI003CCCF041
MAEKRRLSARERREPAAKRRVSEATTRASSPAQSQHATRRKASTPATASSPAPTPNPASETVVPPISTKIKDGEPLPVLPSPQPADLSLKEYQSIAESAVLLASLERSKKKWLSDGILERYWTKPKKTKREQLEGKNPPKESMSKVGPCNIVVGPHLFDAMLYTVKDPNAPPPVHYTPTQRPMVHYGHPNNFQQYHPYPQTPHSAQNQRAHPPQTSHAPPQSQQGYRPPPQPARTPNNQTPHRPPGPQPAQQRPAANQNPPAQPPKPNPDPVIQMLATRAAQDPELKALMRLVASTNATQEQLRTFQAHIDELNAIIRTREQQQRRQQQQQQRQQPGTPTPTQPPPQTSHPPAQVPQQPLQQPLPATPQQQPSQQEQRTPTPQGPPQPQQSSQARPPVEVQTPRSSHATITPQNQAAFSQNRQTPAPQPMPAELPAKQDPSVSTTAPTPAPRVSSPSVGPASQQSPATQPLPPVPQHQATAQRPGPQYQYQQPPFQGQPIQSRPPQYGSPAPYYRSTPAKPPVPPRFNYKSVVFEFTSPLTPYGSSTSGHAGSGDRYLFPENTILEWLPGGTTVIASFLLVRKVDPNASFPIETSADAAPSRAKGKTGPKSKKADKNKDKAGDAHNEKDKTKGEAGAINGDNPRSENKDSSASDSKQNIQDSQGDQKAPQPADPTKPASDTKTGDDKKSPPLKEYYQPVTFRIYSSNPKTLEPLARVVKPQEEVRKYMNEVMDRAERAPDGFLAYRLPREQPIEDHELEVDHGKKGGTPVPGSVGRSKPFRGRNLGEDSEAESTVRITEDDVEEEELKDYYGPPTGFVPLGI